ncbi:hypothetical protein SUGI_0204700 [Cryptomeria japonica]|nr:hypothetical protein SUGI_0204700 [Cryptomeria japonica]
MTYFSIPLLNAYDPLYHRFSVPCSPPALSIPDSPPEPGIDSVSAYHGSSFGGRVHRGGWEEIVARDLFSRLEIDSDFQFRRTSR